MTSINRLTRKAALVGSDIIPLWDSENNRTRGILAEDLKQYTDDIASITSGQIDPVSHHIILGRSDGSTLDLGQMRYEDLGGDASHLDLDLSSFPENAVLGVKNGRLFDTGLRAENGELKTGSNSVTIGDHTLASGGENLMTRNERTGVTYTNPWQEVTRNDVSLPTYRMYTSAPQQTVSVEASKVNRITNPSFNIAAPANYRIFAFVFEPAETQTNVDVRVHAGGQTIWEETIDTITKDAQITFNLDDKTVPLDVKQGFVYSIDVTSPDGDVVLHGNSANNTPFLSLIVREWVDLPIGDMNKSDYDSDGNGSVDTADALSGAVGAAHSQYYGKDSNGIVGFHNLPAVGVGTGDMTKAEYDTDSDGKVDGADEADKVTGVDAAENGSFYGKDKAGTVGFFTVDSHVKDIKTIDYAGDTAIGLDDLGSSPTTFIFTGSANSSITLPQLNQTEPRQNIVIIIKNQTQQPLVTLNVVAQGVDTINDSGTTSFLLAQGSSTILVSERKIRRWYSVGGLHEVSKFSNLEHLISQLQAEDVRLQGEIDKHTTAIDGHGTQLASHAGSIQTNTNNIKLAADQAKANAEAIVTARKNAVTGMTVEPDRAAKTITLKLTSEQGVVDTALININGWFDDNGGGQVGSDHKIYYGFSVSPPLDEAAILRLGTVKTVPSVAGLDIEMTRSDQTSSYMWAWLPDSAGTIKGFTFGGFLSVWQSTAISVAGIMGKFYTSPNQTSAQNVKFEVTQ